MTEIYPTKWADPSDMQYKELTIGDLTHISYYYSLRPNKSCDSSPMVSYLYKYYYNVKYFEAEDALIMSYHGSDGSVYGFIPFCDESRLDYYFKLQENYFNRILGIPLVINSADEEGVLYLQASGALENYDVIAAEDLRDYIYDGDALRTLAGRKYSKKRNHINKFLNTYRGRWYYRSLTYSDLGETLAFLNDWMRLKRMSDQGIGVNEDGVDFDPAEELDGEYRGICSLINSEEAYGCMKIGGIFIDDRLSAFSIGVDSESCSMAIIDVEKAYSDIDGLYQMINREFLLHEFPEAELVNREDDVGIEGLRKSKLSYFPCTFEHKYILKQKDFKA
ncbi:MAG: phosphatidylglycerol lysyltransferase domain-containing protein [Eubacteriales bacterium]|nr:phosphatidylglycerol lysyltransferase domain-containing protein [Eubacteriales bacterium]